MLYCHTTFNNFSFLIKKKKNYTVKLNMQFGSLYSCRIPDQKWDNSMPFLPLQPEENLPPSYLDEKLLGVPITASLRVWAI